MAKNGTPNQMLAMIGPSMASCGVAENVVRLRQHAHGGQPVRQRADNQVQQPGPGQPGQEQEDHPGQEHQRLDQSLATEAPVQQQGEPQPQQELARASEANVQ